MAGNVLQTASLSDLLAYALSTNVASVYNVNGVDHIVPNAFKSYFKPSAQNLSADDFNSELVTDWQAIVEAKRADDLRSTFDARGYASFVSGGAPSVIVSLCQHLKVQEANLGTTQQAVIGAMGALPPVHDFIVNSNVGSLSAEAQSAVRRAEVLVQMGEQTTALVLQKMNAKTVPDGVSPLHGRISAPV
jgi:hypothetical protein